MSPAYWLRCYGRRQGRRLISVRKAKLEQASAAALDKELSAIEFRILRYRNARGAFPALTKDLDGFIRRIDDNAACKIELRSKWSDLEEINLSLRSSGGSSPTGEHKRLLEMVLDELVQICQANR